MPKIQIPDKLKPILTTKAQIVVIYGGRGSAKSETLGRVLTMKAQTEQADILCGREYQNSIDDSVHKLIKQLINNIPVDGFNVTDKRIDCLTGGGMRFKGFARNPEAVKSAQDFKYSWVEQAECMSQESIDDLLPTILRNPGSKAFFTANPMSSADPFSKEFLLPFWKDLQANGYYEDDLYLIIRVNWRDNPWHKELEPLRLKHFETKPRAWYDHIWEGEFYDSIEDPLVLPEWFDACIDAHKKLGFEPVGIRYSSHDPSDVGPDNKGFAFRHGSVLLDLQEKIDGTVNEGCDWATGLAINHQSDAYTWDCDGMGVALNAQVVRVFKGKPTVITMFKGSEGVDNPDNIFESVAESTVRDQKTNKEALKNKRAQYYLELRKRIYKTWEAVNGTYHDPDELLSFDSSIKALPKFRSELCMMPIKPNGNGLFELYPKPAMKVKFKIESPNLADSVMMLMRAPHKIVSYENVRPQPIKTIGRR